MANSFVYYVTGMVHGTSTPWGFGLYVNVIVRGQRLPYSLVPRPPRPSAEDGLGALVDFLGTGARFWPDPIRSLDFAYHTIITLQITCGW